MYLFTFIENFINNIQALTDEQKHKAEANAKECIKITGVDPAIVHKLKAGDVSNKDEKTQCFAKCFLEKAGFLDSHGNVQEKVAREKLGADGNKATVSINID